MAAPGWQTSELDEEWPDQSLPGSTRHPFSPAASSSSQSPPSEPQTHSADRYGTFKSIGSGRPAKPSTTPFRVVSGHTHNSLGSLLAAPPVGSTPQDAEREKRRTSRLSPPSSAGGSEGERRLSSCTNEADERETSFEPPAGTFLVKETEEERPKHLRNPFIAKAGGGLGAGGGGGSLFQPLALESMFKPPSPSAESFSAQSTESPARSTSPTEPVPTALDTTGSRGTLRRTSHSYVPARPSRLSESMSPELTRSESSSHRSVEDQEEAVEELASLSPESQAGSSQRKEPRRFSGRIDSMQDVSFTFSPRRETSPQAPPKAGDDVATPPSKASLKLFSLRESVAVYLVNDERGLETPLVSAGRKQRAEHRNQEGVTSWQSEEDLVKRGERKLLAGAGAEIVITGEQDKEEHEEGETSTDVEMRERKPKRIRLDSPSVDSDSSPSRFAEEHEQSPNYRSPASSGHQDQSTPRSFASSESPASLNDTQRLQFHMGLISPVPRDGLYVAGNRQSWEQRGSAMLQLVRNQFQYEGDASRGGMVSPSTITNSGSEQTPESAGGRDSTFEGTVRERSESYSPRISLSPPGLSHSVHSSKSGPGVIPSDLGNRLAVTRTSSTNTAIYVGPDRNASRTNSQTASSATVRATLGINGTVNSQSSGSSGTVTTSGSGSTVTSKYLSEGMNIMDRIRERKCSESSGTMTGPDHEADAVSSSSAGRPTSALSNHRGDVSTDVAREDSAADMRRSRMASLRAEQGQDRQVRPVSSSSSLSASSKGSSRPTSAPLDRPPTLAPLPASADDLNRFISAATTTTYKTGNTAASTSFVKHRGPPTKPRGLHSMGLEDIPKIPAQVGKMIFDRQQSKWVRAPSTRGLSGIGTVMEEGESSEGSLDIFAGLESLRDDRATQNGSFAHVASEGGQMPLEGFISVHEDAFHGDGANPPAKMAGKEASVSAHELQRLEECVSLDDVQVEVDEYSLRMSISTSHRSQGATVREELAGDEEDLADSQATQNGRPQIQHSQSDPTPILENNIIGVTPLRSVTRGAAVTPVSAMRKSTSQRQSTSQVVDSATKRNVSFSDGKRPGRTSRDLPDRSENGLKDYSDSLEGDIFTMREAAKTQDGQLQSTRSKRINNMLQGIENETLNHATPTKLSHTLTALVSDSEGSADGSIEPHETDSDSGHVPFRTGIRNQEDATFLTECSFAVSHDKLVQIITEVQPFEPYWEELTAIDLSKRGATSVARLKEFLPRLDVIDLSDNQISYLSGIPSTVRTLSAAGNKISSLTAINHLQNIQYLDLSRNDLDGVNALSCLRHLREVKLDHNRITDLGDLLHTDSLVKISCSNNRIAELDLRQAKWPRLEMLDVSKNRLTDVFSLERLVNLVSLNLDGNELAGLEAAATMSNLRVLRLSNNQLLDLDLSSFTRLRTLYADNNRLHQLSRTNLRSVTRLENLSLRNQRGVSLKLSYEDLRDVKRLYISGNPLATDFFPNQALYSLAYLEAAACKLSTWPRNLAQRMPNLRHVNLNYNFLKDLKGLSGLQGLRKLSLIGARLGETGSREIISDLRGLGTLESVDIRMNPCTLNYYLPIIVTNTGAFCAAELQNNDYNSGSPSWASMDINFRRSLPDEWYSKRLLYRGLMTMACEQIDMIDGIRMTPAERTKARQLVESALQNEL